MYIGTSLSGCLVSLLDNEVPEDKVLVIISRTDCPDYDKYISVVKKYYTSDNYSVRHIKSMLSDRSLIDVLKLAERLWEQGKIHQPRSFATLGGYYSHPGTFVDTLWLEIVPTNQNSNSAVVDAYEKYKMLDILTK